MRIAVTGAAGLLGSSLVKRLRADGQQVFALARAGAFGAGENLVRWDAADDWKQTEALLTGMDVVIHAAAHVPRDHSDASEARRCVEVNAIGTLDLIRAAESAKVRRFIYVSGANVLRPTAGKVKEDDPVGCEHSPYYLGSKVLGEIYVRSAMQRGMQCLIVRPSSIYGPGMRSGVLLSFASSLLEARPITLNDGGRFQADYIWRDDVVDVLVRCAADDRQGSLNLGAGQTIALRQVAEVLCDVLGADKRLVTVGPVDASAAKGFAAVDIARAQEWYQFEPTPLRTGLSLWFGQGDFQ